MFKKCVLLMLISVISTGLASAETIKICTDRSNWYPFTFRAKGNPAGIHIDITTKALVSLGHQPVFTA